jgi:predicted nucleotidyltransferase
MDSEQHTMSDPQPHELFKDTPVLVAYLFGSRANGHARPSSDRDIAVLLEPHLSSIERGRWRLQLIGRLIDFYRSDAIDLIVLNDAPPMLRFEVIRNRHVLYNRDDEARVAFEVQTMQEWFDWAPRYRRLQRARIQRFATQPSSGHPGPTDEEA